MRKFSFVALIVLIGVATVIASCSFVGDIEALRAKLKAGQEGQSGEGTDAFTVTFNLNGGSGTVPAPHTVPSGSSVTLPGGGGLSKAGFTFGGWNANTSGTGANYNAGASYTVTGDITLYAKWNEIPGSPYLTVQFDTDGGENIGDLKVLANTKATRPSPDPIKEGYTLAGWYTDPSRTTTYNFDSIVTGNFTLYAKWTANSYTVIYNKNTSDVTTGTTANSSHTYDVDKALTPNGYSRAGYAFAGWAMTAGGEVEFADEQSVKNLVSTAGTIVTLYAQWTAKTYVINFANTGGTGGQTETVTATYGQPMPVINEAPTHNAIMIFSGYWDADSGGKKYYNTNKSSAATWDKDGLASYTLYAQWVPPSIDMVFVLGGTFQMGKELGTGTSDVTPLHDVTLADFYIGKYEVTQKQYQDVMGKTIIEQQALATTSTTNYGRGNNYPMYYVSWYDAIEFCNALSLKEGLSPYYTIDKINQDPNNTNSSDTLKWTVTRNTSANGYRLPTEAQWEYAAKGGNQQASGWTGYTYSGSDTVGNVAWYSGNNGSEGSSNYGSKAVGTKTANRLGIFDMSGNVREWCWDWYGDYTSGTETDPVGASSGSYRVLRGGGWVNIASFVRSVNRNNGYPYYRVDFIGFRLARP